MKRGVVASAEIITPHSNGFRIEGGVTRRDVNFYTLYWDRVVLPTNCFGHTTIDDEELFVDCGLVERPLVPIEGITHFSDIPFSEVPSYYSEVQAQAVKNLMNTDRDVDWVLHQIGDQLVLPRAEVDNRKTLRFDLINALPIPSENVMVPDILEFKERRADELHLLHSTIDDLYLDILRSPDESLSAKKAVSELKKSIADVGVVAKEKWARTSTYNLSVNFNLDGGKLAAGAVFDFYTNMFTVPVGTMVGALMSNLKVSAGRSVAIKASSAKDKLSYLSSAHKEGIIARE